MALVESHDCNWEESGCAIRSFLVCFWYDFIAASKMAWKREEDADVDGVWDMGEVETVEESRMIYLSVMGERRKRTLGRCVPRLVVEPLSATAEVHER